MADIVVIGAGVCGLASAMLLTEDGHDVTVLERDDAPVPSSGPEAWTGWTRRGVAQFHQAHWLHAGGRQLLDSHLPEVAAALAAAGGVHYDQLILPSPISDRAPRPGDERFVTLTGRRPVIEYAFASVAAKTVDVRRGEQVAELLTGPSAVPGVPNVTGVRTESGKRLDADLVIDASGRRSALPRWLAATGARAPLEEIEDFGFNYYTRYFASPSGPPQPRAGLLAPVGSITLLTLPADNGTWSITAFASSRDHALRELRRPQAWTRVVAACPLHAHWLDGEPLTDVLVMGGQLDRYRRFVVEGEPVVTGAVAVGDAWACTNPSLGRGISLGLLHATHLREVVRSHLGNPAELAECWDAVTEAELTPWYRATVKGDRARHAQIEALIAGRPAPAPPGNDPAAAVQRAFPVAMAHDADVFRAFTEIVSVQSTPSAVLARPGMIDKIMTVAADREPVPIPGPNRQELLGLVA
jgi:2-polyprenyl-6-methoxyphenol hydroxylase-like FAD-dependent oxidoreductase